MNPTKTLALQVLLKPKNTFSLKTILVILKSLTNEPIDHLIVSSKLV